jgi:TPP-dependent indolepyruvate ferredoxin oxidoreductase alpha subunit
MSSDDPTHAPRRTPARACVLMSATRQKANMAGSSQRSLLLALGSLGGVAHAPTSKLSVVVLGDFCSAGNGVSAVVEAIAKSSSHLIARIAHP